MKFFLLKPRWLVLHLIALGLAILFTNFGFWQLRRLEQRQAQNQILQERLSDQPRALSELISQFKTNVPASDKNSIALRPAFTEGQFDTSEEVLLRTADNYNGQPGYYLLTPLILENETVLLVKRGWVPFDLNKPPITEAKPASSDKVNVEGFLLEPQTEPTGFWASLAPRNPEGELDITAYLDVERLEKQMPYELLPFVLELETQAPEQAGVFPQPNEAPTFTNGSHLGYAIQWFSFTLIGVVGYIILMIGLNKERQSRTSRKAPG